MNETKCSQRKKMPSSIKQKLSTNSFLISSSFVGFVCCDDAFYVHYKCLNGSTTRSQNLIKNFILMRKLLYTVFFLLFFCFCLIEFIETYSRFRNNLMILNWLRKIFHNFLVFHSLLVLCVIKKNCSNFYDYYL